MSTERRVKRSVALAIHDEAGHVLLVQRPPDDPDLPLVWGLPAASLASGESWEDAVRRAARDKLGAGVEPVVVLREGAAEREAYRLEMRLWEARLEGDVPTVPQSVPGVTQYVAWRWGRPTELSAAAARGSICSRLYLEHLTTARKDAPMVQLDLTRQETQLVADAIESYLSDLRMEISDTDSQDFREKLKVRKAALEKALAGLRHAV